MKKFQWKCNGLFLALFLEVQFWRHLQSIKTQRRGRVGLNTERKWEDEEGE